MGCGGLAFVVVVDILQEMAEVKLIEEVGGRDVIVQGNWRGKSVRGLILDQDLEMESR